MNERSTNWTKKTLKTYLLLYCANADFIETDEEKELIHSKINDKKYKKIYEEFNNDNDYQRIQKIQLAVEEHQLSQREIESLIEEIKNLFLTDGKYDQLEENLFLGLKRLLRNS